MSVKKLLVTNVLPVEIQVRRKRQKASWSASADKAKHLDLTEEFDPGSE
jgi:hypothetical protein